MSLWKGKRTQDYRPIPVDRCACACGHLKLNTKWINAHNEAHTQQKTNNNLQPDGIGYACADERRILRNVRFVLEKWKDIGYSYNHSRTMVSQVSIAEEGPSSRNSQTHRGDFILLLRTRLCFMFHFVFAQPHCSSRFAVTDSPHPNRLPVIPDSNELHI